MVVCLRLGKTMTMTTTWIDFLLIGWIKIMDFIVTIVLGLVLIFSLVVESLNQVLVKLVEELDSLTMIMTAI